jgi:hypothetical protein
MSRLLCLLTLLCAGGALASEPIRLAMPGFTSVEVSPELAGFYADRLAQQLAFQGVKVVTARDMTALLGHERQKALLGCGESSCAAELAGALGVDGLVVGDVAKLGRGVHFTLRVLSARDGERLASFAADVEGEDLVLPTLERAAKAMAAELSRRLGRTLSPGVAESRGVVEAGPRAWAWAPAAAGLALGAGGGFFLVQAGQRRDALAARTGAPLSYAAADQLRRDGWAQQTLGAVLLGAGAAGLVGGGVMYLLGGARSEVQGGMALLPGGGAAVGVSGVWP